MHHLDEIRERILKKIAIILGSVYGEQVDDLTEDSLMARLSFKGDPHLNELRLALDRIHRGDFGKCIFCKGSISDEVLLELPTAHFCRSCADVLMHKRASTVVSELRKN